MAGKKGQSSSDRCDQKRQTGKYADNKNKSPQRLHLPQRPPAFARLLLTQYVWGAFQFRTGIRSVLFQLLSVKSSDHLRKFD
jgi:hypothetical protein